MQEDISEQNTALIPHMTENTFHTYLRQHKLLWVTVARAVGVPCLTVWSIDHGLAVFPLHALQVRQGVYKLTGIRYNGPIETIITLADPSSHNHTK